MNVPALEEMELRDKRVLIRQDFNVPLKNGEILNDRRIRAALPTIRLALEQQAKVILMSHLGRPREDLPASAQTEFSLAPVAARLSELLGQEVKLMPPGYSAEQSRMIGRGDCALLENVRFNAGEKDNAESRSRYYAELCDVFVMDAFGAAHRAHASTCGVAELAPAACAGLLLSAELAALGKALENPQRPMLAIVGGAKIAGKLQLLEALAEKADCLLVGGGIANTFLAAAGKPVGGSLHEANMLAEAKRIMALTEAPLPSDVVVARECSATALAESKPIAEVAEDDMILDLGPRTAATFAARLASMRTILWNGPMGVFELEQFSAGTEALARAIAASSGFSIAGGGETLAAIAKFQVEDGISYISTGGGAFLEFAEGRKLPAVAALERRSLERQ